MNAKKWKFTHKKFKFRFFTFIELHKDERAKRHLNFILIRSGQVEQTVVCRWRIYNVVCASEKDCFSLKTTLEKNEMKPDKQTFNFTIASIVYTLYTPKRENKNIT